MDSEYHYNNIQKIQEIVESKLLSDESSLEELLLANDQILLLIDSLNFWIAQGNEGRYDYDLSMFLSWAENLK